MHEIVTETIENSKRKYEIFKRTLSLSLRIVNYWIIDENYPRPPNIIITKKILRTSLS